MFAKVAAGDPESKNPARSARWLNAVSEAARHYHEQLALGGATGTVGLKVPVVKAKNITGADLDRGDVVQLGAPLLDPNDPYNPWFEGKAVAEPAYRKFAIARRAIKEDEIGEVVINGHCLAHVVVADAAHRFAEPVAGEVYLESSESGPVELLSEPGGTGPQELWVNITHECPSISAVLDEELVKDGFAMATIRRRQRGTAHDSDPLEETDTQIRVFDSTLGDEDDPIPVDTPIIAALQGDGRYYVTTAGCSTIERAEDEEE